MGYSLQANMKNLEEGGDHPDRDQQFRYLNARVRRLQREDQPVISVDTKKKELIGQYYFSAREDLPTVTHQKWATCIVGRVTVRIYKGSPSNAFLSSRRSW